jgi:hypothetical protein
MDAVWPNKPGLEPGAVGPHSNRRSFIGGSDARIIMGHDEGRLSGFGEKSAARSSRRTCPAISSSNSGW